MPGAEDEASSTTHSAIAPGTITTTKEKTDLSQINRDTANALNKLDHIFDKKTIEEKQELAKLFAKNGNELIHKVSEHYGWADGDANKVALYFLLGGLTAQIAGGDFSSGAWAAGVNEQLSKEIADGDSAKVQLYSAVVGAVVNSLTGDEVETGSATAQYGTKWNLLLDSHAKEIRWEEYQTLLNTFDREYVEQIAQGNPYSSAEAIDALNELASYSQYADGWALTPAASELLHLFLDQDFSGHGIVNVDYTQHGYKVVEFGENSVVNNSLKNERLMNIFLVKQALANVGDSGVDMPTYVTSNSLYEFGLDTTFGLGRASSIVTIKKRDPFTIEAKITIIDNWDHDKNAALDSIYKAAYIVQQSGLRDTYAFKTTYDVTFSILDLYQLK